MAYLEHLWEFTPRITSDKIMWLFTQIFVPEHKRAVSTCFGSISLVMLVLPEYYCFSVPHPHNLKKRSKLILDRQRELTWRSYFYKSMHFKCNWFCLRYSKCYICYICPSPGFTPQYFTRMLYIYMFTNKLNVLLNL